MTLLLNYIYIYELISKDFATLPSHQRGRSPFHVRLQVSELEGYRQWNLRFSILFARVKESPRPIASVE